MKAYKHLSLDERNKIGILQGEGKSIPNRIDISERPKEANERVMFGHFEADSIESCRKRGETLPCLTVVSISSNFL